MCYLQALYFYIRDLRIRGFYYLGSSYGNQGTNVQGEKGEEELAISNASWDLGMDNPGSAPKSHCLALKLKVKSHAHTHISLTGRHLFSDLI